MPASTNSSWMMADLGILNLRPGGGGGPALVSPGPAEPGRAVQPDKFR
jgi:hypothetical protein